MAFPKKNIDIYNGKTLEEQFDICGQSEKRARKFQPKQQQTTEEGRQRAGTAEAAPSAEK